MGNQADMSEYQVFRKAVNVVLAEFSINDLILNWEV